MPNHSGIGGCVLLATLAAGASGAGNAGLGDLLKSVGGLMPGGNPVDTSAPVLPVGRNTAALSTREIDAGLKQALSIGARRAVAVLGRQGGFLNDPSVRIRLPGTLEKAAQVLRLLGQGRYVDQFEQAMNRAAEQAIPKTLGIVQKTVRGMTLDDARKILTGGDTSATDYLRRHAGQALQQAIEPIVARSTDAAGVTAAYKRMLSHYLDSRSGSGLAGALGGVLGRLPQPLDLDRYITAHTVDGLFTKLAVEEQAIRRNPVQRTTTLLRQVFSR